MKRAADFKDAEGQTVATVSYKTKEYIEIMANEGQFDQLFSEMHWTEGFDSGQAERWVLDAAKTEGVELDDDGTDIGEEVYEYYMADGDKGLS